MLRHLLDLIVAPAAIKDADRLIEGHGGTGAAYLARNAAMAARDRASAAHWNRVLAAIEFRLRRAAA